MLWVRISIRARCTTLSDQTKPNYWWCNLLWLCSSLVPPMFYEYIYYVPQKIMKIIYVYFPLFIDLLKKKNIHNKINEIQYSNSFAFFYNIKSITIYKQEMTKTCFKQSLMSQSFLYLEVSFWSHRFWHITVLLYITWLKNSLYICAWYEHRIST